MNLSYSGYKVSDIGIFDVIIHWLYFFSKQALVNFINSYTVCFCLFEGLGGLFFPEFALESRGFVCGLVEPLLYLRIEAFPGFGADQKYIRYPCMAVQ